MLCFNKAVTIHRGKASWMACVAAIIIVLLLAACSNSGADTSATASASPSVVKSEPPVTEVVEVFPQKGYMSTAKSEDGKLICAPDVASIKAVVGRTIDYNGVQITATRDDDAIVVTFVPENNGQYYGIIDGRAAFWLEDAETGALFDTFKARDVDFAPKGEIDPEYQIKSVVLCGGGL